MTPSKIPSPAIGTTVTKTDSGTTSVTHRYSDGEQTVIEEYRVYYGDGEHLCDDTGAEVGIHGFYVDVTPTHRNGSELDRAYDQLVSDVVSEIAESRGPIEQVKGILMFVYRIEEQQAWELLKWRSQETNVKLRALAVQLAADIHDLDYGENLPRRSSLDRLLMTAHLRASPAARLCARDERPRC